MSGKKDTVITELASDLKNKGKVSCTLHHNPEYGSSLRKTGSGAEYTFRVDVISEVDSGDLADLQDKKNAAAYERYLKVLDDKK